MVRLGLLQHKNIRAFYDDKYLVARLQAKSFASLTRDYDLVFRRKRRFGHRFTL